MYLRCILYILVVEIHECILWSLLSMIDLDKTNALNELLNQAKNALVICGSEATFDQVASGIALAEGLREKGAEVSFLMPSTHVLDQYDLELGEIIKTQLGNRDLLISFPYQPELVEKVSYHIDETTQRFCLVVKPQAGFKPLNSQQVEFEYVGAQADIIFLVGVHNLENLEQLYFGYEQLFQTVPLVTLHTFEPSIGTLKFDLSGTSCMSESVTTLLTRIGLPLSAGAATNLLAAVEVATDNFKSYAATAETFEAVAQLLRSGARRKNRVMNSHREVPLSESNLTAVHPTADTSVLVTDSTSSKTKTARKNSKKVGGLDYQPSQYSPASGG